RTRDQSPCSLRRSRTADAGSACRSDSAAAPARPAWPHPRTVSSTRSGPESAGSPCSSRSSSRPPCRAAPSPDTSAINVGDGRLCQGSSGPGDGFLQLDPEGVPLAQRLVVAGEYLGALVVKAHPLDGRAREHAEPKQIQSESDADERHPARVHAVPLSESLERYSSISARRAESSRHATSPRAFYFHGFRVFAQPDHVARRWPIARIVGRKVAKASRLNIAVRTIPG